MPTNTLFAIGLIALQIFSVVLFVNIFLKKNSLHSFIEKNFLQIGFFATLSAVVVSMIYSTGFGYAPCTLCWWARIFMFPQLVLFFVGWVKKKNIALESFLLSLFGLFVSGYHTYIDFAGVSSSACGEGGVSCLQRYVFEFGYITIPVMALSGFVFLAILSFYKLKK
jgi:disulfide bond formation protein DsbB